MKNPRKEKKQNGKKTVLLIASGVFTFLLILFFFLSKQKYPSFSLRESLGFSKNAKLLYVSTYDSSILWDLSKKKKKMLITGNSNEAGCIISPNCKLFAVSQYESFKIIDIASKKVVASRKIGNRYLEFSPDSKYLIISRYWIYDIGKKKIVAKLPVIDRDAIALMALKEPIDGAWLLIIKRNKIVLYDLLRKKRLKELHNEKGLFFSRNHLDRKAPIMLTGGNKLFFFKEDLVLCYRFKEFRIQTIKLRDKYEREWDPCCVSFDGHYFAVGHSLNPSIGVNIYNVDKAQLVKNFHNLDDDIVHRMAIQWEKKLLAIGYIKDENMACRVSVYDFVTGKQVMELP